MLRRSFTSAIAARRSIATVSRPALSTVTEGSDSFKKREHAAEEAYFRRKEHEDIDHLKHDKEAQKHLEEEIEEHKHAHDKK
mmetsp:Transcript_37744/g.97376  ORF Transcript_37744/g.97376 Transcript_37744/m.97376 type:complete len:82 (-) Transcript_37744:214-459(-)|eukprot:CAMPEP_0113888028 /NCGR_PEP_ID=MMETSP0780_2-20120614/12598_1 /TAXON_ID=652834 /ORGANISM="Palpitomonas bilix" /LENGTH=81 /DNA_ID=CAMNT_0000876739 /DNA_START=58 /DNA_END=303 /DNA_ORIENTATION=- /assembly_acc=CAM_ASM_000599